MNTSYKEEQNQRVERPVLRLDDSERLLLVNGEAMIPVRVQLCFPWTDPDHYFSLRDADDKEVQFVEDPAQLDGPSREALLTTVGRTRFVFEVTRVVEVRTEHELRLWEVVTEQGTRRFQTKLDDWPRMVGKGAWLIRDVSSDLYLIRNIAGMDSHSQHLLSAFIDAGQ